MNSLRPLEHWDRGFESQSRHGCFCAFILCLCCSVYSIAMRLSPVQGVVTTVRRIKKLKSGLSIYLPTYLSICPSVRPSVRPYIHTYIHPSIHPSIHPWLYSPFLDLGRFCSFLILCTVGRLLGRGSARRKDKRTQTSMPWVGFEPTIPAFERAKTVNALGHVATVIGLKSGQGPAKGCGVGRQ
jgi:hypothetical protein